MESNEYVERNEMRPNNGRYATNHRILVVEDSPSARKLLQELLLRLGVGLPDLRMAATVPEALQLYAQWRPDIVFLDLQLRPPPDARPTNGSGSRPADYPHNGADLALQLLQRNPALKIVVCSASDPADTAVGDLVKKGKVEAIVKPILAARVKEVLGRVTAPTPPMPYRR